jgi:AcrR family transcriptional regulator
MPRPARFSHEQIVAATARVAAERGPARASVARIARTLRAPTGSIYHRFASRSVLLGEVWLQAAESFQDGFLKQLDGVDPHAAGLAAVRYGVEWVREHPQEARILLLHRREDFLESEWPTSMRKRARALREQLSKGLRNFCQRLLGRADAKSLRIVTFALAEAPLAAVKRHIEWGEPPPKIVDALVAETYLASLSLIGVSR